jgi:methyl-accepting chemotaxis protein
VSSVAAASPISHRQATSVGKLEHSNSVDKVRTGSALVEIMEGIKKVSDIVAEMEAASEEQATGIEQVNTAVR